MKCLLTTRHQQTWLCSNPPGAGRRTPPRAAGRQSLLSWSPSDSPTGSLRNTQTHLDQQLLFISLRCISLHHYWLFLFYFEKCTVLPLLAVYALREEVTYVKLCLCRISLKCCFVSNRGVRFRIPLLFPQRGN